MKVKNRACEFNATFSGIISLVKGNKEGRKNRHYIKWASWKNVICSQIFIQRSPQTNSSLTKVSWNVGGIHPNNLKGNWIAQKNPRLRHFPCSVDLSQLPFFLIKYFFIISRTRRYNTPTFLEVRILLWVVWLSQKRIPTSFPNLRLHSERAPST